MTDLGTESYGLHYSKLKLLITLLCLGKPEVGNVPLPFDVVSQIIILNTNRESNAVRHSRDKECPINRYIYLNLYSIVRSKSFVQILFQLGIVLSYDRILSFVNEVSQVVKNLHSGNKVLHFTLRMGIFTSFIDDNLYKNSSSVDAKARFHGTAMLVVKFLTADSLGLVRTKKYKDPCEVEKASKICRVLDYIIDVPAVDVSKEIFSPIKIVNLPDIYEDLMMISLFKRKSLVGVKRKRYRVDYSIDIAVFWYRDISDDIVPMPVIHAKSNTIDLQYHLMKTAVEYTQYLNPMLRPTIVFAKESNSVFISFDFFMGGPHIKQAVLVCICQLLKNEMKLIGV